MNRNIIINNDNLDILETTKNLYMVGDTKLRKKQNDNLLNNKIYKNYGVSENTLLPDFGINMGSMPREKLSKNSTLIESELFGINKLNSKYQMKKRKYDFTPRINKLDNIKFFDLPKQVLIPEPLIVEKYQRPEIL
jgi:hypothetical protein